MTPPSTSRRTTKPLRASPLSGATGGQPWPERHQQPELQPAGGNTNCKWRFHGGCVHGGGGGLGRGPLGMRGLLAGCGLLLLALAAVVLLALLTPTSAALTTVATVPSGPMSVAANKLAKPVVYSTAAPAAATTSTTAAAAAVAAQLHHQRHHHHNQSGEPRGWVHATDVTHGSPVGTILANASTSANARPRASSSAASASSLSASDGSGGGRSLLQQSFNGDCCTRLSAAATTLGLISPASSLSAPLSLPLVLVDSGSSPVSSKDNAVRATVCSCSPPGGSWDGRPYTDFVAEAQVKLRGSSSLLNNKKSFNIKFRTRSANGGTSKLMVPVLGMPADDEWALYGPESDKTLGMRNVLAYDIFRRMGRWAPRTRYCEVFLLDDGLETVQPRHYAGVFVATERVTVGPDRVNVRRMDPDKDLSGGYILGYENDNIAADDLSFRPATSLLNFVMHQPEFDDVGPQGGHPTPREAAALRWITAYMAQMEGALLAGFPGQEAIRARAAALSSQGLNTGLSNGWNGPTAAAAVGSPEGPPPAGSGGWRGFVELGSFVDYLLATELYKNPDGYRGSVYMSKNVGSPIAFGPPWDYNEAFGICCGYPIEGFNNGGKSWGSSGGSAISPEGWRFNICDQSQRCKADPVDGISQYYRSAWRDPALRVATGQRWQELRAGQLSDGVLAGLVDSQRTLLRGAALRDYNRWASVRNSPYFKTHEEQWLYEVEQLRSWLLARARWMDEALSDAAKGGWASGATAAARPASSGSGQAPSTAASLGFGMGTGGGVSSGRVAVPMAAAVQTAAGPVLGGRFMNLLLGGRRR